MSGDERVERMLRELGGAEAPEGLERRIALGVEGRLAVRGGGRATWRPGLLLSGAAASAVLVTLLLAAGMVHHDRTPGTGPLAPAGAKRAASGGAAAPEATRELAQGARAHAPSSRASGSRAVQGGVRDAAAMAMRQQAQLGRAQTPEPKLMAASYAPTTVAPPEPLTRQERLLLRVVRRGDAEQKQALDARVRDAQFVAEKAEVEAFFKPPALPKQDQ